MSNFSFLACLERAEKVVVGGGGGVVDQVTTMSNPNPSCIEFELGSGFDNSYLEISLGGHVVVEVHCQ